MHGKITAKVDNGRHAQSVPCTQHASRDFRAKSQNTARKHADSVWSKRKPQAN
jgi:hypothetical protein